MHPKIIEKIQILCERVEELHALLADKQTLENPELLNKYNCELAKIQDIADQFTQLQKIQKELADLKELESGSADLDEYIREEEKNLQNQIIDKEKNLQIAIIPKDPDEQAQELFLEIRAGTGGDEAAIFAGDLLRMYSIFCEKNGLQIEKISQNQGEKGGFKEIVCRIFGTGCFSLLKFESGVHRVQRVPETENSGRIHTSAATVAILPVLDNDFEIKINPSDLRIDTYRSSGAGGQHINKTDSAVRIVHIPSGIVVECQEERSQHKNRAKAMSLLQAKLNLAEKESQTNAQSEMRKSQVGSGDRSERIRTYNFPQNRLSDHRINLTLYKLDEIIAGDLSQVITPLQEDENTRLLLELQNS